MAVSEPAKAKYDYDVALSFAGEDREFVDEVARALARKSIRVFYDTFEEANLVGKNLYDYLTDLYLRRAQFCAMFISKNYAAKIWPNQERQAAQARALQQRGEYVLPIRLDEADIPGLLPTIAYLKGRTADAVALIVAEKIAYSRPIDVGSESITSPCLQVVFYSPLTLDRQILEKSWRFFEGWPDRLLDKLQIRIQLPSELQEWMTDCEDFQSCTAWNTVPSDTQKMFQTFCHENRTIIPTGLAEGLKLICCSINKDAKEDFLDLLERFAIARVIAFYRRLSSFRLTAMKDPPWIDLFREYANSYSGSIVAGLPLLCLFDSSEVCFWADADLMERGSYSFDRYRIYVPLCMILEGEDEKPGAQSFHRFITPQLVDLVRCLLNNSDTLNHRFRGDSRPKSVTIN